MKLSDDEKSAIIAYRIEKSRATFAEAEDNAKLQNWSLVANRLYYAAFYMILALNLVNGVSSKTHNGTFALFSKQYIQTGILTKEEGHIYRTLYSMRQSGDYDDLFDWDEEDILPIMPKVSQFLAKLLSLVKC